MDILPRDERSALMSRIKGKDTRPELAVRSLVHALGYRFRLHRRDLPGTPDMVFPRFKKVVFVHGCFWHRHSGCRLAYTPKSNERFWATKFLRNVSRDKAALKKLRQLGWGTLVVWECELIDTRRLTRRLTTHLSGSSP